MGKDRLAAFSDGVIAILITIMVLELKVPSGADWTALQGLAPSLLAYVLSFVYLAIYWNNHHHLLHTVVHVNGLILWANSHLLFWLSLVPAATAWMGQNLSAPLPTAVYGAALLMPAIAYYLLQLAIIHKQGSQSVLAQALGSDIKGKISPVLYVAGIVLAFVSPWVSVAIYALVAIMWLVPDRRIENASVASRRPSAHLMTRDYAMRQNSLLLRAILLAAIVISAAGAAFAGTWRTYYNDRYGTTIEYPDNFQPGNPPDANDGLAFTSPDGASFSVFASYNALDFDLAGYQDFIVKNLAAGKVITYRAHGRDWFVISGTAGADRVFYERYRLSHSSEMTEGFVMSYPSRLKQKYDPIVARMAKSFRPGEGYQTPPKR